MIIHPVDYILDESKLLNIYQDTDTHIGSDGHDDSLHRRFVNAVKCDPCAKWIHTGDMLDEDRPSTRDRKFLAFHDRPEVIDKDDRRVRREINESAIDRYRPIADKCLGILDGDHFRIFKDGTTSGQYIAEKLGVKYLGERMAFVSIRVKLQKSRHSFRYDILARHGRGVSSTAGGDVSLLSRQNARWDADLYLGGHTHGENVHLEPLIGVNIERTNLYQRTRCYMRGGSFLRGFIIGKQLYPEQAEYSPLCVGWGRVELRFGQPKTMNGVLSVMETRGTICVG